ERDRKPRLELRDALHERGKRDRTDTVRRQTRKPRVGGRESAEGVGPRRDDGQAATHVVAPVGRRGRAADEPVEAAGDRLYRGERVVQLVPDDADQPLPRLAFLLAKRLAHVGQHEQLVRQPALPELGTPDLPTPAAPRERDVPDAGRSVERLLEAEAPGAPAQEPIGGAPAPSLARATDQ